jgi:hypothetical protein
MISVVKEKFMVNKQKQANGFLQEPKDIRRGFL